MLAMLRVKLTRPGNGGAGEYALLPHVRDGAGFTSKRTLDAVAVSLWPSRGFTIHGYEIKCSRSDWLRELKQPAKAEAAAAFCDRFSIVVSDRTIVHAGELPPTWGLLAPRGDKLATITEAPMLPGADHTRPIPRSILVTMLRSAGAQVAASPAEVLAAREEGRKEGEAHQARTLDLRTKELAAVHAQLREIEDAAGVRFSRWGGDNPAKVGAALRVVLADDGAAEKATNSIRAVRTQLANALEAVDRVLDAP